MKALRSFVRENPRVKRNIEFLFRMLSAVGSFRSLTRLPGYFTDLFRYVRLAPHEANVPLLDLYPCLHDKIPTTGIDSHYFYMGVWAARRIYRTAAAIHVDVGSQSLFVGMLTAFTEVHFVDIRPLDVDISRYHGKTGSILSLPFEDNSVRSLSCLHVAEHVGLGRFGDPIDPAGTVKGCRELARVLGKEGNLFFALPIGRPRECFNAHRVHDSSQILGYFRDLELIEFSGVDDRGLFRERVPVNSLDGEEYGCGLFWFKKL